MSKVGIAEERSVPRSLSENSVMSLGWTLSSQNRLSEGYVHIWSVRVVNGTGSSSCGSVESDVVLVEAWIVVVAMAQNVYIMFPGSENEETME